MARHRKRTPEIYQGWCRDNNREAWTEGGESAACLDYLGQNCSMHCPHLTNRTFLAVLRADASEGSAQEESLQYQIYPRVDKLDCRTDEIGGGAGPTAQAQRRLLQAGPSNAAQLGLVRTLPGNVHFWAACWKLSWPARTLIGHKSSSQVAPRTCDVGCSASAHAFKWGFSEGVQQRA